MASGSVLKGNWQAESLGGFLGDESLTLSHWQSLLFLPYPCSPGMRALGRCGGAHTGGSDGSAHLETSPGLVDKATPTRRWPVHVPDLGFSHLLHRCRLSPGHEGLVLPTPGVLAGGSLAVWAMYCLRAVFHSCILAESWLDSAGLSLILLWRALCSLQPQPQHYHLCYQQ